MARAKNSKPTLLLHIGTAFLRAGLSVEGTSELSRVKKIPIALGGPTTEPALFENTKRALKELCEAYEQTAIGRVRVLVSSPWYQATVRSVEPELSQKTRISRDFVLSSVEKYKDEEPPRGGNVDLESVAVQVLVDGYQTALKKPVEGSHVRIQLYESEMAGVVQEVFLSIVSKTFPHTPITFYSFAVALSLGIREMTDETSFIAIDIGGEATEVVMVDQDALAHVASIPEGYYSMARLIGGDDRVYDTLSKLALLTRGELEPIEHKRIQESFEGELNPWPWTLALSSILTDIAKKAPTPRVLFVISEHEISHWVVRKLEKVLERHSIRVFGASAIAPFIQPSKDGGAYDIPLAVASVFFELAADEVLGTSEISQHARFLKKSF